MSAREQATWTRARLGRCGPPLDLLTARFDRHVYASHTHEEFSIGICVGGSEVIDYRGDHLRPGPGSIVVLAPGEMHTGRPAASDGYAYRALYPDPSLLTEGTLGDGLPYFREPLLDDPELATALSRAHTELSACPDPLEAESRLPWLLTALARRHSTARAAKDVVPGAAHIAHVVRDRLADELLAPPPSPSSPPTWGCPATNSSGPSVRRWGYRRTPGWPSTGSPGPADCWSPECGRARSRGRWASPIRRI